MAGVFGLVIGLAFTSDKEHAGEEQAIENVPDNKNSWSPWKMYRGLARGIMGASDTGEDVRRRQAEENMRNMAKNYRRW